MLNMQALETALQKVETLGKGELTLDVNGTDITIRVLLPDEEVEAIRWAHDALADAEDDDVDRATAMQYLDRIKIGVLAYAIIQIGSTDLRDQDFVETGEVLDSGIAVKLPKYLALRELLRKWQRDVLGGVYRSYTELMERVELEAEKAISFDLVELDAEIDRVEKRLVVLKALKKEQESFQEEGVENPATDQFKAAGRLSQEERDAERAILGRRSSAKRAEDKAAAAMPTAPTEQPPANFPERVQKAPAEEAPPRGPRQSTIPQRAVPPMRSEVPPPPPIPDDGIMDSMADDEDAIAAENARLMAMRVKMRRESLDAARDEATAVTPARSKRSAPHESAREAANQHNAVLDVGAGSLARAKPEGKIGDREAYRLPTTELSYRDTLHRARSGEGGKKVAINQDPSGEASKNPRFKKA